MADLSSLPLKVRGRIKDGAPISQDFQGKKWPLKPEDADIVFTITAGPGAFLQCRAPGYGEQGRTRSRNGRVYASPDDSVVAGETDG